MGAPPTITEGTVKPTRFSLLSPVGVVGFGFEVGSLLRSSREVVAFSVFEQKILIILFKRQNSETS